MGLRASRVALVAAFLVSGTAAAQPGPASLKEFSPLLGHLPADVDLVAVADLAALGRTVNTLLDGIGAMPVVARHPELKAAWDQARKSLVSGIADLKGKLGVDVLADLDRGVLGVSFGPDKVRAVALVRGRLDHALVDRFGPDGKALPVKGDAKKAATPARPNRSIGILPDGLLFVAEGIGPESLVKPSKALPDAAAKRHPGLSAPLPAEFLVRISVSLPDHVMKEVAEAKKNPFTSTVLDLDHLGIDVSDRLVLAATARSDAGAARYAHLAEGVRELVAAGRSAVRAFAFGVMGLDFEGVPGLPPMVREALADGPALQETVDQWFGPTSALPEVKVEGRVVTLSGGREAFRGMSPIAGTLAAIAVPSFIKYMRMARRSEAHVNVRQIQQAETMWAEEHGGEYLKCGPVPAVPPSGDAVKWPGDKCFDKLGFHPGDGVRFSYQVAPGKDGKLEVRATGDIGGGGLTVFRAPVDGSGSVREDGGDE